MDKAQLWTADLEDHDIPDHIKTLVEALLADPTFLAWLDQQDAAATCPC